MTRLALILALLLGACSSPAQDPQPSPKTHPERSCDVTLKSKTADAVTGEFNDWKTTPLEDGSLTLSKLDPGEYAYAFVTNGKTEDAPPHNVYTKWFQGTEYRDLRVGDCHVPAWQVNSAQIKDGELTADISFVSAAGGPVLDPKSVQVTAGGKKIDFDADPETGEITVDVKLDTPDKYTLEVSGKDADGTATESDVWLPLWYDKKPWTWQDAILYLAFTDRFRDSDGNAPQNPDGVLPIAGYEGGDFAGIQQAIEEGYFDKLGVDTLWLSPIYDNTDKPYVGADGVHLFTGYHGYWPIDPLKAEPKFGGDDALHTLIESAHAHGMRIVFDVVLNHVDEDHVYCTEHPDWCKPTCVCGSDNCDWDTHARTCQFAPYLYDLDYRNHAIVQRVVSDVMKLAQKFDVDGFRIDAAKHMDHVIMRTLRLRLNELEDEGAAPFWMVGETFTGDRGLIMQYVGDDELHGQFDFPLYYAIRSAFAGNGSFKDLDGAAGASQNAYGANYQWMSPFLGNHDVQRFATETAGNAASDPFGDTPDLMADGSDQVTQWDIINRMSMAFAFLLTQPGIPLIYYGDEVGLAGAGDPDNRRMMPQALSANQLELLKRVQELGQIRRKIPALRHGDRKQLWIDDTFYVYVRSDGPGEVAIVGMNKGDTARTESVQIPSALELADKTLTSVNSDRTVKVINGAIRLSLDPWEYVVLVPK